MYTMVQAMLRRVPSLEGTYTALLREWHPESFTERSMTRQPSPLAFWRPSSHLLRQSLRPGRGEDTWIRWDHSGLFRVLSGLAFSLATGVRTRV